ncbi:hypothetical protein V2J09_022380 [Rumex salicifolius]
MPLQIASFRLVHFLKSSSLNSPLFPPLFLRCHGRLSTVCFASSPPPSPPPPPGKQLHLKTRSKGSLAHTDKPMPSHPPATAGFNKRRAEGRDKADKPKSLEKKVRRLNPINTISYLQIIGTGMDTQDTSSSVLLFFDHQRFIFNAGEGLQRFCTEHKIKLSKIDHIFLSRVSSETAGGLPGLLLTLAAEVGTCVNIWGPSDLDLLVKAMKLFIPNAAMVHTKSFGPLQSPGENATLDEKQFAEPIVLIDDEVVKISAILLRPNPLIGSGEGNSGVTLMPGELSVVYVFELPDIQGKFDPEKAKAFGLKPGPKYRELQLNKSVKSDCLDMMVHPSDVMDPPIPGPIVLLVDCPAESHLQHLSSSKSLDAYYASPFFNQSESAKKVNCVIHLSPSSVIKTSLYQEWMSRLGDVQHIFAGHESKNAEIPILQSSARVAARLNFLCPQFFPASGVGPITSNSSLVHSSNSSAEEWHGISAENLMKFHLRPYAQLGLDLSCIPCYKSHEGIIHELLEEIPEIEDAAKQVKRLWIDMNKEKTNEIAAKSADLAVMEEPDDLPECLKNITREDMEITLLGTGSSQPSKYRNVSSIFINLFSKGTLLFDSGEGTLAQLKRRFGLEGADVAVRNLRCIWISHIHADHHTGLARILALRRVLLKGTPREPLIVIGPRQLKGYLDAYQRLEDLDFRFLDCKHTTRDSWAAFESDEVQDPSVNTQTSVEDTVFGKGNHHRMQSIFRKPVDGKVCFPILKKLKETLLEAGIEALVSFPVIHCPRAYGVVLKASERLNSSAELIPGWKVVYSGDTRPCPELIEASRGATALIHEATFEDSMVEEAIAKNHSTTKEAIEAGEAAGVYRIILTHFSQRYPKIPVLNHTHMHNTCIAFDLMTVNMADLPLLPDVLPYLTLLFKDEMLVEDDNDQSDAYGFRDQDSSTA